MGKKNRIKHNRWKKQLDSNPRGGLSIILLDARKELDFEKRNDDIISTMPDDILCHIISFLPFKSAVQTSFLSTRWKDLWKRNFSVRKGTLDDAFVAISSFLHDFSDQSQQPTSNWGFQFNFGKGSFLSVAGEPDKALHLDFSNVKHEFPWRFDWLLKIEGIEGLRYSYYCRFDYWSDNSQFSFTIKTLHLKSVSYLSSGAVSSMISNFKYLESLTLEKCNGLQSLQIKDGNRRLKKLIILDCQQLESLYLKGCKQQSLRYRGKLLSFQCVPGSFWSWTRYNALPLVDAMLDFRQGPACSNISGCGFTSLFYSMKNVKSLTLCQWVFEALICPMLDLPLSAWDDFNPWDDFRLNPWDNFRLNPWDDFQLKELTEFWWIDYAKETYNSNALISFLKLCPRLKRLYITIDPKCYKRTNTTNCSVKVTRLPRLEDLKVVKMEGFPNEKEEITLAKRLKQEFDVEPLIIAKSNYLNCVRLLVKEPPADELKKGKDSYKFIETRAEHLHDLCPKHVHMSL